MLDYISRRITAAFLTDAIGIPTQVDILDADGISLLTGQEPDAAPALVTPGSISPASGPAGTVFTITPPVFSGRPTPTVTRTVTLAGSPITVTGSSYTSTAAGALATAWSATNGVGSPSTSSASATVTAAGNAPVITQQPSISPASATVGDSVTINLGAATGAVGPATWTLMRGATNVTAQVDQFMAIEFAVAGTYTLNVSWTNAHGTINATAVTITVAAAPGVGLSAAAIHIPNTSDPAANLALPLVAQGRLAASLAATAGGGALQTSPRGIEFNGTNRLILNNVDISGGYYMVGVATIDALVGAQTTPVFVNLRTAGGHWMQIRRNGSNLQANWTYGTATNSDGGAMPASPFGGSVIFGVEVNPVAGTVRTWNGTAFASKALGATGALETSILRLGGDQAATNFLDGAIRDFTLESLTGAALTFEQAIATLTGGGSLPETDPMDAAFARYEAPETPVATVTSVTTGGRTGIAMPTIVGTLQEGPLGLMLNGSTKVSSAVGAVPTAGGYIFGMRFTPTEMLANRAVMMLRGAAASYAQVRHFGGGLNINFSYGTSRNIGAGPLSIGTENVAAFEFVPGVGVRYWNGTEIVLDAGLTDFDMQPATLTLGGDHGNTNFTTASIPEVIFEQGESRQVTLEQVVAHLRGLEVPPFQ